MFRPVACAAAMPSGGGSATSRPPASYNAIVSFDERAFFSEKPESRPAKYPCPRCKRTNEYTIRWMRRTKKDRAPQAADERAKFDKLRDHLLRLDDEVTCMGWSLEPIPLVSQSAPDFPAALQTSGKSGGSNGVFAAAGKERVPPGAHSQRRMVSAKRL